MSQEIASLGNVLTRLEEHFSKEPQIKKRASEIEVLIDEFYHKPEDAQVKLESSLSTLRDYQEMQKTPPQEVSPFFRRPFENSLISYLIYQLEQNKVEKRAEIKNSKFGPIKLKEWFVFLKKTTFKLLPVLVNQPTSFPLPPWWLAPRQTIELP